MCDLLKEAIADAKAVRETALVNAKLALEEAFTPKIQSMLSKKIQSETEGEAEEGEREEGEDIEEEYEITLEGEDDEKEEDEDLEEELDKSSGIGKGDNKEDNTDVSSGIGKGGKLKEVQDELKEYKEAVVFLKDKLHEVNILNAKLLFTNKLFKQYSLDNNQKLKVVETFDRAQTTREIKLVFSTLAEQFNDNGSIVTKKSISESASAPVSSTKPSTESRKVISEETQVANRFKKLAGLIK